ncbi:MAG: ABC transporter substrate-binding protein [Candidatus Methanogasteraceae archaeon]
MKTEILLGITTILMLLALPAAASDYTLGVFGNANEDETINMQDVTYTELIILEYRDETELADAKYDDKINMQDVTQIELVILGKEKELTVLDSVDRVVTLEMPIETIVVTDDNQAEFVRLLGAEEKVVGIERSIPERGYFPVMSDKPDIGNQWRGLNYELVAELDPDVVIMLGSPAPVEPVTTKLDEIRVEAVCVDTIDLDKRANVIMLLGYILGNRERAAEYLEWREGHLSVIRERLNDLDEEDKPTMLFQDVDYRGVFGKDYSMCGTIEAAGLINIADFPGRMEVDPEWILIKDPDIILLGDWKSESVGYKTTSSAKANESIEEAMDHPGFDELTAVKNGDVYLVEYMLPGTRGDIGVLYFARMAHPDKFEDIDPVEMDKEYFEDWLRVDYQGIFFHPPTWND